MDVDCVYVGGVNLWVFSDGGNFFICLVKWSYLYKFNYVYVDIYDINVYVNGDLWLVCDGGIFYFIDEGVNFDCSMEGISGSDFWGFGVGYNNDEFMFGGVYYNGIFIKNGMVYDNDWVCMDGGDGVGGVVYFIFED